MNRFQLTRSAPFANAKTPTIEANSRSGWADGPLRDRGCILTCNAQDVPTTYPVRGVVLNSLTHRPIARALIDGRSDAALTGNDGRFEINLPEGRTPINVRRPGYNNPAVAAMMQSVNVGPNTPDLTFYLTPEASVSVHVTLANGDAADGIRFMVYRRRVDHGHRIWMLQGNYTTDSDGSFRMTDLEAHSTKCRKSTWMIRRRWRG